MENNKENSAHAKSKPNSMRLSEEVRQTLEEYELSLHGITEG